MFGIGYDPGLALFLSETRPDTAAAPHHAASPAPAAPHHAARALAMLAGLAARVLP